MNVNIYDYLQERSQELDQLSTERKQLLARLADYIRSKREQRKPVNLVYICTHNSRRSHFGQVWAKVAADFYGIENVQSYSGGTEATAFNVNAINALKRVGFQVTPLSDSGNPVYELYYKEEHPIRCFSKVYDHPENPGADFAAIMTCSDAEENCPFIPGVELRIATTYDDPKAFDGTPLQDEKYDERCQQIARETLYVFSQV